MPRKVLMGLDLDTQRIQRVGEPTAPTDAATKSYVDQAIADLPDEAVDAIARAALLAHLDSETPHAAYDDINPLSLYENKKI